MSHAIATADNLQWPDYLAAILAHLLLITLFFVLGYSSATPPPPFHAVQVQLITSPVLQKKTTRHHNKPTRKKVVKKKALSKTKPAPKKVIKHHLKPSPKKSVKRKIKSKKIPSHAKPKEPDFDPFAPQQSASDAPTQLRKHHPAEPASIPRTSSTLTSGMTSQEINRYIARIQRQVQNRWKVPTKSPLQLNDPEVLLRLNRNGSIMQITISTPSGDPIMDRSLIKAIRAAAPFDLPPNNFDLFRINRITFHPLH